MSLLFDMILHIYNSIITVVYFTGVMKVKKKSRLINEVGLVFSLFAISSVSQMLRYYPPLRFMGVLVVMIATAFIFFDASVLCKLRTVAESIVMSMAGELFGIVVYGIVVKNGYDTMKFDSPDRAVMSLVLSVIVAGMVPMAILWRQKARTRELWSVALFQVTIAFSQVSMIMLAYFSAAMPSEKLVYILMVIQIPGFGISLFCARAIMAVTKLTIDEKEQEFEKTKADMEYDYYKLALESNAKLSMLRHDISNTLQTAMTLMKNGDMSKGDELLLDIDRENRSTAPVVACDKDIINVVLTLKRDEMNKCGISLRISAKAELCEIPVSDRELTSVITNLLDNAKEACLKCNGEREVIITFGRQQGFYIIKVENTYCREDVYIPESVAQALTTKDDKELHGFGLRSIYEISKKHDGNFSMYREDEKIVSIVTFSEVS